MYRANSLIFNGIDFGNFGVIESINRPLLPGIQTVDKEILGRDGRLFRHNKLDPLTISFSIRIFENRRIDDILDQIVEYMYTKRPLPLNYNNNITWYDAVLESLGDPNKFRSKIALIEPTFYIPNPIGRSKIQRSESLTRYTDNIVSTKGNYPTKPNFTASCENIKILNVTTGDFIRVNLNRKRDIWIDCNTESVTNLNGDVNLIKYLSWDSDFFEIENGDVIKIIGYDGDAEDRILMSYYERYYFDRSI